MQAIFDENGYWTGDYCTIGELAGGVEVETIPNEEDEIRKRCYRHKEGELVFNEEHYQSMISEKKEKELSLMKKRMIAQSKSNLKQFLSNFKLTSSCHGDIEQQYSITENKQSQLHIMISLATMAQLNGADYQCSWNATGKDCTYDWTLEELQQLGFEIESVVRPLVSKQRELEVEIRQADSLEKLQEININFNGECH